MALHPGEEAASGVHLTIQLLGEEGVEEGDRRRPSYRPEEEVVGEEGAFHLEEVVEVEVVAAFLPFQEEVEVVVAIPQQVP